MVRSEQLSLWVTLVTAATSPQLTAGPRQEETRAGMSMDMRRTPRKSRRLCSKAP